MKDLVREAEAAAVKALRNLSPIFDPSLRNVLQQPPSPAAIRAMRRLGLEGPFVDGDIPEEEVYGMWERVIIKNEEGEVVDEFRQYVILPENSLVGPWRVEVRQEVGSAYEGGDQEAMYVITSHWATGAVYEVGRLRVAWNSWQDAMGNADEYIEECLGEAIQDLLAATGNPLKSAIDATCAAARDVPRGLRLEMSYNIAESLLNFQLTTKREHEEE